MQGSNISLCLPKLPINTVFAILSLFYVDPYATLLYLLLCVISLAMRVAYVSWPAGGGARSVREGNDTP